MELINNKLVPAVGKHLKSKDGQIFESAIWLGIYDSKDNYVEVSEEEYQKWLEEQNEECNVSQRMF